MTIGWLSPGYRVANGWLSAGYRLAIGRLGSFGSVDSIGSARLTQLGSVGSSYWVYLDLRPESDLKIAGLIAATLLVCAALALVLPETARTTLDTSLDRG